jgi:hypothetical protein
MKIKYPQENIVSARAIEILRAGKEQVPEPYWLVRSQLPLLL